MNNYPEPDDIEGYAFQPEHSGTHGSSSEESSSDVEFDVELEFEMDEQTRVRLGRRENGGWCHCTNCEIQTPASHKECVCCREEDEWDIMIGERVPEGENCITANDEIRVVCLLRPVLATAWVQYMQYKRMKGRAPEVLSNRQNRLMAYRQFCLWAHRGQRLGKNQRKVLPACIVAMIRDKFPEENPEDYGGYSEAALMDEAMNIV